LKCKTVAEASSATPTTSANLAPYIVDEPPDAWRRHCTQSVGSSLAALGSCLAVGLHANAVHRGWIVNKLELELEVISTYAVWGTATSARSPSASPTSRQGRTWNAKAFRRPDRRAGDPRQKWSPVANTFTRPVNLEVSA